MGEADETYRAIGRFISEFSQLEYTIRHYLSEEIRLDDKYFDEIISPYDVGLLCNVCIRVFEKTRTQENAKVLKSLVKDFKDMVEERNTVAHGLWIAHKESGTVIHWNRNRLKSTEGANRIAHLEKLADQMVLIRNAFETQILNPP